MGVITGGTIGVLATENSTFSEPTVRGRAATSIDLSDRHRATALPNRPVPRPGGSVGAGRTATRAESPVITDWLREYVRCRDLVGAKGGTRHDLVQMSHLKANIAQHYTGMVESIARRFLASGEPVEDLVQEGFLGFLSALEKYDPDKGVKFSTFATHFVAGAMNHYLRDRGKIIKEPAWLHELRGKINRTTDTLTQTLGRIPTASEIGAVLNLTEEAVEEVLSTRQVFQVAALETGNRDEGDGGEMVGLVDPEKIRSDRHITLQLPIEDRVVLENAMANLKVLEQRVLHEFFYKDLSQTEIAKNLNISCNYVSHIIKNSTQKLRRVLGEAEVRDRTRQREGSVLDSATGLYTAEHLQHRLEEELSLAARGEAPLAVMLLTVDGISAIPKAQRDEIWQQCCATVRGSLRRVDIAGVSLHDPCGIIVLLPRTGSQAPTVGRRLCDRLIAFGVRRDVRVVPHFGVAHYPHEGRTAGELLTCAMAALGEFAD